MILGGEFLILFVYLLKNLLNLINRSTITCVVAEHPNGQNPKLLTLFLANCGASLFLKKDKRLKKKSYDTKISFIDSIKCLNKKS